MPTLDADGHLGGSAWANARVVAATLMMLWRDGQRRYLGGGGGVCWGQGGLEMDGVDGTRDVWVLQWRPQGASGGLRPYLALAWELQVWVRHL